MRPDHINFAVLKSCCVERSVGLTIETRRRILDINHDFHFLAPAVLFVAKSSLA